jgi:hypothetical protein
MLCLPAEADISLKISFCQVVASDPAMAHFSCIVRIPTRRAAMASYLTATGRCESGHKQYKLRFQDSFLFVIQVQKKSSTGLFQIF